MGFHGRMRAHGWTAGLILAGGLLQPALPSAIGSPVANAVPAPHIGASPTPSSPGAITATIEQTVVGKMAGFNSLGSGMAVSRDGNHVAFIGIKGKKQVVVADGLPSADYDWIIPASLQYSPDSAHLSYLVQTAAQTIAVIDGKQGSGFFTVDYNALFWSVNSQHYAMAVKTPEGKGAIVVDGIMGNTYDAVDVPVLSPDGAHAAYGARRGGQSFVVWDGKEQKPFDAVGKISFSPDSRFLVYEAVLNKKAMMVLNASVGKAYDAIGLGPGFNNSSTKVVAVVADAGKLRVVINGRESEPYEAMVPGDFVMSPDGKRNIYAVKSGNKQFAIIDGQPQTPFDRVLGQSAAFSPDSQHVAYAAADSRGVFLVVDGSPQPTCDDILSNTPIFSPDSRRIAYGAKRGGKWHMVVDGATGRGYDVLEPPVTQIFSPDSQHVAYRAANLASAASHPVVVVDGVESSPADRVGALSFSPDSKHVAYLRVRGEQMNAVVDSVEVATGYNPAFPELPHVYFDDSNTVHFIAGLKDEVVRVKVLLNK